MPRKTCLIKISGDMLSDSDNVFQWIKKLSQKYLVVVCVGGAKQINEAFAVAGLPIRKFGPLGRETKTQEEKELARKVLEANKAELQGRLAQFGIHVNVVISVMEVGNVLCHVNGDQFVLTAYHGFDILYVITTKGRVKKKKSFFAPYKKIHVKGF